MCSSIPEITLKSSSKGSIPSLGYGTAAYPFSPDNIKQSVIKAINLGYRHLDTAALYRSEEPLGQSIAEALRLGLIPSRDELFVTSKLWCSDAHPGRVIPALRCSLKKLGLEYLDLYLIHWPMSSKPGKYELFMDEEELQPMDFKGVWEEMEECQRLGLSKAIGVSNFSCKKLQFLLDNSKIPPAVNQVELNPFWQQKKLIEFCKEKGIHITGYSPLGAKGAPWGSNQVMDSNILQELARAKGKTIAQICMRWAYEQGASVIVKSFNEERMKENMDIFDWNLSQDELQMIEQIPQKKGFPNPTFVSPKGPYKTLHELWDGEI